MVSFFKVTDIYCVTFEKCVGMIMDICMRFINQGPDTRMIDKVKYQECFQYFDREVIIEVINLFLLDTPGLISTIRRNLAERDHNNLLVNVVKVKGSVINFCDPVATDIARHLEKAVHYQMWEDVGEILPKLEDSVGHLERELMEIRHRITIA